MWRNYGATGKDLRESIASRARNLATRKVEIQNDGSTDIEAYLSYRLIPLDKLPSVYPIGIGEVIVYKSHVAERVGPHNSNCVLDNYLGAKQQFIP